MIRNKYERKEVAAKFQLGSLRATHGALKMLCPVDMADAIVRHSTCDWGELCEHDWNDNELSLVNGNRLLSRYISSTGVTFWIITEAADEHGFREATTILLPSEY